MIDLYRRYLKLVNDPTAAAILAVGEQLAGKVNHESLTPKQAAKILNLSTTTIYDLCKAGRLRSMKIGRAVRIEPEDLEHYRRDAVA